MKTVPQIRVFLASPGDVNEERAVALQVLDMLEYDPLFKRSGAGGVSIHAVAWDKPGGDTAMRATKTPQTAIKEGLPGPSECDVVLVLFWGRMGTPLPHPEYQKEDGSAYLSGTEWEFWDAVNAERTHGKPVTLLFRRTEEPHIDMKDRKQIAQYHAVLDFFEQFRDPVTGALLAGVNEYATPEEFKSKLERYLRNEIISILDRESFSDERASTVSRPLVEAPPLWEGSPFPGLRAFTEADAPIFFGRGVEVSELVRRVDASRFVAVVAASGSGKSSLVAAGLIPRLKANAIVSGETGSKDWRFVRFTPGGDENPLAAMFRALCAAFPEHAVSPFMVVQEKAAFITSVSMNPSAIIDICDALLAEAKAPAWAEILLFVDQFEELFTLVKSDSDRATFIAVLEAVNRSRRMRCVVTMRSDFYAPCLEYLALAELLKAGTYPLAAPTAGALVEMIKRPAERAGLTWDDGLPERIQADTGSDAGSLALMAYALDELYNASHGDKRLTFTTYKTLGGVEGAIGKRAEKAFSELHLPDHLPDKEHLLRCVFRELITVDDRGTATRQRASLGKFSEGELAVIRAFVTARLLVTGDDSVEVAHEAIFRSWVWLKNWIIEAQEDLILLRQVRNAAAEWDEKGRPDYLLWPQERLALVYAMQERLNPELDKIGQDFIEPEQNRLLREIEDIETDHKRRRWIGERLATIGDPRSGIGLDEHTLPQIDWLPVSPGGEIEVEKQRFTVKPFYVAKYLITYPQFQAFLDAPDGFEDERWWQGFPKEYIKQAMSTAVAQYDNYPRDSVSWYQAVAFTRWLDTKYREHALFAQFAAGDWQIRLPTEQEWQWMAQNGTDARRYPWGSWDEHPRANTTEAGIGDRSTAVGMYPHGIADCGALDVAGNLFEWCLNDYENPEIIDGYSNEERKVLRGGSFNSILNLAAASYRDGDDPNYGNSSCGFRLVLGAPIVSLSSGTLNSESE